MARQKRKGSGSESIRKLTKTGKYTYYVTIPKTYIDTLGWREKQCVEVVLQEKTLIIRDVP